MSWTIRKSKWRSCRRCHKISDKRKMVSRMFVAGIKYFCKGCMPAMRIYKNKDVMIPKKIFDGPIPL